MGLGGHAPHRRHLPADHQDDVCNLRGGTHRDAGLPEGLQGGGGARRRPAICAAGPRVRAGLRPEARHPRRLRAGRGAGAAAERRPHAAGRLGLLLPVRRGEARPAPRRSGRGRPVAPALPLGLRPWLSSPPGRARGQRQDRAAEEEEVEGLRRGAAAGGGLHAGPPEEGVAAELRRSVPGTALPLDAANLSPRGVLPCLVSSAPPSQAEFVHARRWACGPAARLRVGFCAHACMLAPLLVPLSPCGVCAAFSGMTGCEKFVWSPARPLWNLGM
mmetsp:Transcript_109591/g.349689  ORF Transcript_109591/g.349689 Transcript_109591/m.349689 type:complete len:274 (+) Transcript_109591:600-1421(+)